MAAKKQPLRERDAKGAANETPSRVSQGALQNFKTLARRLVNVPREQLHHEEERYQVANAARRKQRKRGDG